MEREVRLREGSKDLRVVTQTHHIDCSLLLDSKIDASAQMLDSCRSLVWESRMSKGQRIIPDRAWRRDERLRGLDTRQGLTVDNHKHLSREFGFSDIKDSTSSSR